MSRTFQATIVGLLLGLAFVLTSFADMLVVALFGIIGWGIAKVLDGDVDLQSLLSRSRDGR